jgi:hypothetical protein
MDRVNSGADKLGKAAKNQTPEEKYAASTVSGNDCAVYEDDEDTGSGQDAGVLKCGSDVSHFEEIGAIRCEALALEVIRNRGIYRSCTWLRKQLAEILH